MPNRPLGDELVGFADHLARRANTPGTVRSYLSILRAFHGWLQRPLLEATSGDIDRWLASRELGPRARYTYISCLASFYQWAQRVGRIDHDPTGHVERPRLPRPVPRPMSTADFQTALAHADPRMRAWLALAGYAGLRCQEIAGLTVDDLLFGYDPPLIVVRAGKGRKQRVVAMHDYVQLALRDAGIPPIRAVVSPPGPAPATCRRERPLRVRHLSGLSPRLGDTRHPSPSQASFRNRPVPVEPRHSAGAGSARPFVDSHDHRLRAVRVRRGGGRHTLFVARRGDGERQC